MSIHTNPFHKKIRTLDDVRGLSLWGDKSIDILRKHFNSDSAHDKAHIVRVLRNALYFGSEGDLEVLIPATILHDLVNLPKDHPNRHKASQFSATKASHLLMHAGLPVDSPLVASIIHAIQAHSWSAKIEPLTIEAKALQDADRLDSLGNIGLARLFATGGSMGRTLFHPTDPMAKTRELDELKYTLDHYFVKLVHLPETMKTELGKQEALHLRQKMHRFIGGLVDEI